MLGYCLLVKKNNVNKFHRTQLHICASSLADIGISLWKWLLFSIQLTAAIFLNEIDDVLTFAVAALFFLYTLI